MGTCVFCDIIAGKAPASVVYQDERCVAFMDIRPINPGHLLVVPRYHAASLAELPPDIGGHIFQIGQKLDEALRQSGLKCEGVNLVLADGAAAGQEIFHVHLHVLPRFRGDGFGWKINPATLLRPGHEKLEENAQKIRQSLG
jgi:diadenosine tetraphosphate (Ap4A) HIT family hydrolase